MQLLKEVSTVGVTTQHGELSLYTIFQFFLNTSMTCVSSTAF